MIRHTEDGQALHRLPVREVSWPVNSQLRLRNRLAHIWRKVTAGLRPAVSAAHGVMPGTLAVVTRISPTAIPAKVNLFVVLGLFFGGWAIVRRRVILGLILILLALAVAGTAALFQEGQHAMQNNNTRPVVTVRSPTA